MRRHLRRWECGKAVSQCGMIANTRPAIDGVEEVYLYTRTLEVYALSNAEYALLGEFTGEDKISSGVLEGIDVVVSTLFG